MQEFFAIKKNVDINKLKLQEEVQDIRWFTKEEIINDDYKEITDKVECW